MSKAAAPAPEKANSKETLLIDCVLEDVLPVNSDSTIKVKKFKKFLNYDLETLNITGELQTYTHKNDFTHTKMVVTYQDKTTNKVNYLEIDILSNTNKKVKNTKDCSYSCGFDDCCCCTSVVSTNTDAGDFGATPRTTIYLPPGTHLGPKFIGRTAQIWQKNQ
jgi:hypothetical protein